jgi:hypothetical protein
MPPGEEIPEGMLECANPKCGRLFFPRNSLQRTCKAACRVALHRHERKAQ